MERRLDRVGSKAALETVRESPFIAGVVIAPAVVAFAVVWLVAGLPWAIVTVLVLGVLGYLGFKFR